MNELEYVFKKYSPQYKVELSIQDIPFTVLTNSAELEKRLREYLSVYIRAKHIETGHLFYAIVGELDIDSDKLVDIPRTLSKKAVKEAAYDTQKGRVILKKRTGVIVLQEQDVRVVVGDLVSNINQVINVIDEVFIADYLKQGYVLLHSSAVVDRDGNGIVFTSESGSGKSTMAVAMLEHGFHYLSNDRVLLKLKGDYVTILGVPKKPRLNPGTILVLPRLHQLLRPEEISEYTKLEPEKLWYLEDKHDLDVDSIYGIGTTVTQAKLVACFILNWERGSGPLVIDKISEKERVKSLKPMVVNLDPARKQTDLSHGVENELKEITGRVICYRVSGAVDITGLARYVAGTKSVFTNLSLADGDMSMEKISEINQ
ncbi:MAG: HprK-related kinase B [Dehalococcoidales bacterium]|nr:HprK-related kinase B [Dehalococcoidales bacterium]